MMHSIRKLPFSPFLYSGLWVVLTVVLLFRLQIDAVSLLFSLATIILYSHVVYGGYYIFSKAQYYNIWLVIAALGIFSSLFALAWFHTSPLVWFTIVILVFIIASIFHSNFKIKLQKVYLQEFCNYKIFIEMYGIVLCCMGVVLYILLSPSWILLIALLNVIVILRLNYLIVVKKKLYKLEYENVELPECPFVSVVVIAYNEEKYIAKCLASIAEQTYRNFEIIVVDDHSTDRTIEIAQSFSSTIPLQIVQKDIRGCSRSRNFGATFAKGELILFLDADVILPHDFLEKTVPSFREQRLSMAGIDFKPITYNRFDHFYTKFYRFWLKTVQYFNPRWIGFCILVTKAHHDNVLFDETVTMCEDFDYVRRGAHKGKFRILTDQILYVSWRRFDHENRFVLLFKYLFFEWYRQNIGEIRKKNVSYNFGHYHKNIVHDIIENKK